LEKGKTDALNSGNYFGFRLKYTSAGLGENPNIRDALLFNIHCCKHPEILNVEQGIMNVEAKISLPPNLHQSCYPDLQNEVYPLYPLPSVSCHCSLFPSSYAVQGWRQ